MNYTAPKGTWKGKKLGGKTFVNAFPFSFARESKGFVREDKIS